MKPFRSPTRAEIIRGATILALAIPFASARADTRILQFTDTLLLDQGAPDPHDVTVFEVGMFPRELGALTGVTFELRSEFSGKVLFHGVQGEGYFHYTPRNFVEAAILGPPNPPELIVDDVLPTQTRRVGSPGGPFDVAWEFLATGTLSVEETASVSTLEGYAGSGTYEVEVAQQDRSTYEGNFPPDPANFPGSIDRDPLFVDVAGPDGFAGTSDDDLHLSAGSPCIDAGENGAFPSWTYEPWAAGDLEGKSRFYDDLDAPDRGAGVPPLADMGAFERGAQDIPQSVEFVRSDANSDGGVDLSDAVFILLYLFVGGVEPSCLQSADADSSESLDISDAVFILQYLFLGAEAPGAPFPGCGLAPGSEIPGCASYSSCP